MVWNIPLYFQKDDARTKKHIIRIVLRQRKLWLIALGWLVHTMRYTINFSLRFFGTAHGNLQTAQNLFRGHVDKIYREDNPQSIRQSPKEEDIRRTIVADVGEARENLVEPCITVRSDKHQDIWVAYNKAQSCSKS